MKISSKKIILIIGIVILFIITSSLTVNKIIMNTKMETDKFSAIPVITTSLKQEKIKENISSMGNVSPENEVAVISETQGQVMKFYAKVGDNVAGGTIIAQIDDELKLASFLTAKASFEKAVKDLSRMEILYKDRNISDSDMENAQVNFTNSKAGFIVAQKQYNDTKIKSPIAGTITDKFVNLGSMVNPGTPIINVIDISRLKVKVFISEEDIFKVKPGEIVKVLSSLYPETEFTGTIMSVGVKGDSTHSFPVEISMKNDLKKPLRAGMSVRVEFTNINERTTNFIPRIALIGSIKDPQIYVVDNGKAKLRNIVIGKDYGTEIEVISGLSITDKIVINGQSNLSDNVDVALQK